MDEYPGSPNWDQLFVRGPYTCGNSVGARTNDYLPAEAARDIFRCSVKLDGVHSCSGSGLSELGALQGAIGTLCEVPGADQSYLFCPQKKAEAKPPAPVNAIDDAFSALDKKVQPASGAKSAGVEVGFAQMEVERIELERHRVAVAKARQQREERQREQQACHDEAEAFCKTALKSTKSCIEDACKSEPSKGICLEMRQDADDSPCNCSPEPCGCLRIPPTPACRAVPIRPLPSGACAAPAWRRDATKCRSDRGEKCAPGKNTGTGVRGEASAGPVALFKPRLFALGDPRFVEKCMRTMSASLFSATQVNDMSAQAASNSGTGNHLFARSMRANCHTLPRTRRASHPVAVPQPVWHWSKGQYPRPDRQL